MEKSNRNRGNRLAKNLYNMLCYNMKSLYQLRTSEVDIDEEADCIDLLAQMMYVAIEELRDNNYFEQYKENGEALDKPKGQIDIVESINSGCYVEGQLFCYYDELSIDNPTNQLIKCAIQILSNVIQLKNTNRNDWVKSYMDNTLNQLYSVSDMKDLENVDTQYRDDCIQQQPEYCTPAIHLSYFIIKQLIPKSGRSVDFIDYQDPASSIIETFIRQYLNQEYTGAESLLGDSRRIIVGQSSNGCKIREVRFDAVLKSKSEDGLKALIIDSKDYGKQSDSDGIHQLVDYYHEFKAHYDTECYKHKVDLVLLFSDRNKQAEDYDKQFHPYSDTRVQNIKIRVIDFDHWEFHDICTKLISIADETFTVNK